MIEVLIADDHPLVLKGLAGILADTPDIRAVGAAGSGAEVLEQIHARDFAVVTLDLGMPGLSGLELIKQLHQEKPRLPVLVISIYPEEQYAARCLKAGASGYLNKTSAPEELVGAVRALAAGRPYVTDALSEWMARELQRPNADALPHERLSDREYEVMLLLARGLTVSEIGEQLFLSVKTVSTYRTRILHKTGWENNAQLMRYAFERGLNQ